MDIVSKYGVRNHYLMVIPFALCSDKSKVKFFTDRRNRNIKTINLFFYTIAVYYCICCGIKKNSSLFLNRSMKTLSFLHLKQSEHDYSITTGGVLQAIEFLIYGKSLHIWRKIGIMESKTIFQERP